MLHYINVSKKTKFVTTKIDSMGKKKKKIEPFNKAGKSFFIEFGF